MILPAYNGERYILQQLISIADAIKYSGTKAEILLGDDGSLDNTIAIVNSFCSNYPHIDLKLFIVNGANLNSNLNLLVSKASGLAIFLSDQDDLWEISKISDQLKALDGYDYCVHSVDFFEEPESPFGLATPLSPCLGLRNIASNTLVGSSIALTSGFASRIFPLPVKVPHDQFIAVCGAFFNGEIISDILVHHRLHDANVSATGRTRSRFTHVKKISLRFLILLNLVRWMLRGCCAIRIV